MVYPSWAAACLAPCSALVKKGSLVCFGIRTMTLDFLLAVVDCEPPVPVLQAARASGIRVATATAAVRHAGRPHLCLSMCPPFRWPGSMSGCEWLGPG